MRLIIGILLVLFGGAGLLLERSVREFNGPEIISHEAPPLNIVTLSGSPQETVSTGDYRQVIEGRPDSADTCANKHETDLFVRDK